MPQMAWIRAILNGDMDTFSTNGRPLSVAVGEQLIRTDKLAAEQLEQVIRLQAEKGGLSGALLVQLGFIGERDLAEAMAEAKCGASFTRSLPPVIQSSWSRVSPKPKRRLSKSF